MKQKMYAIGAVLNYVGRDGYDHTASVPTFYLHPNPQGILTTERAEQVARDILNPSGDSDLITNITAEEVMVGEEDGDLINIKVTPAAIDTIGACLSQCQAIENTWTPNGHPEYGAKAYQSLAGVLARFFTGQGFGPEKIMPEGPKEQLCLFTSTESGFVFGTIFHRTHRPDPAQEGDLQYGWIKAPMVGRFCGHYYDGARCLKPIVNGEPTCEGHLPLITAMPTPGEWSNHS